MAKEEKDEESGGVKVERCRECNQPIDNGDHENGCGFRQRLTRMAIQANGSVIVSA